MPSFYHILSILAMLLTYLSAYIAGGVDLSQHIGVDRGLQQRILGYIAYGCGGGLG